MITPFFQRGRQGMAAGRVQGQQYGHLNLGNVLAVLPESKRAELDLKVYSDILCARHDSMTGAFQSAYKAMETDYNAGLLNPVQAQNKQLILTKQQESIQQFEQDAQQNITGKREELLKPILEKVNQAIKTVAKANGFIMVVDSGSGVLLFADDSIDIMPLVKKALGLPD